MSISQRNSKNSTCLFYDRHRQRWSLLCHPAGMNMLKEYKKIKEIGMDFKNRKVSSDYEEDSKLCHAIASSMEEVKDQSEPAISSAVTEAINAKWFNKVICDNLYHSVKGEEDEKVECVLGESPTKRKPYMIVREARDDGEPALVQLIVEFSVNKSGGEKKIGHAFDYESLIENKNQETVMLLSFHLDRLEVVESAGRIDISFKITQEAFLYVHNEDENERKVAFLWREIYQQRSKEDSFTFFWRSSEGLVRCLNCVRCHTEQRLHEQNETWEIVSDNAAIQNNEVVYKIFDNRFHQTYCRPDQWLYTDLPWIQKLGVEKHLEIKESESVKPLGRPPPPSLTPKSGDKRKRSQMGHTTYPHGSVLIIKYDYKNGTHFASRASHFLQIANWIQEMHHRNIVHGDIRGFNMLHPHPEGQETEGGISESLLIDFDLSGVAESDKYPPGYSPEVPENCFPRSGVSDAIMKKSDDWKDLGSVISCYEIQPKEKMETIAELKIYIENKEKWQRICEKFGSGDHNGAYASLTDLVERNDPKIKMSWARRLLLNQRLAAYKGTGSPNKREQAPRGSMNSDI